MAFKPKWTEEQNNKILQMSKDDVSIADIAKEMNSTEKIIKGRIYFLKGKEKEMMKKAKKEAKKLMPPKVKSETASEIHVSEAPIHPEAEEMRKEYLENPTDETFDIDKFNVGTPKEKEIATTNNEEVIDWYGLDEFVVFWFENRFKNLNKKHGKEIITLFSDDEKAKLKQGITHVLEKRMKILNQYADVINLGMLTLGIIVPRIMTAMNISKEIKTTQNSAPIEQPQELKISNVDLEKQRAMDEFNKLMQKQ